MSIDFILPDIGEGIVECELVEWLVNEGDHIVEDQPIADVMTDKALVQIPAMHAGVVDTLYYKKGDIAKVHAPLFAMTPQGSDGADAPAAAVTSPAHASSTTTNIASAPVEQAATAVTSATTEIEDFILPDIGEGIVECELVEWLVNEGDIIEEDQPIADVMTDKALVQIPAMHAGKVVKLYYAKGAIAKVHAPLFAIERLSTSGISSSAASAPAPAPGDAPVVAGKTPAAEMAVNTTGGKVLASPAVRRVARELNVNIQQVSGSGKKGRVYKDDVLSFAKTPTAVAVAATPSPVVVSGGTRVEAIRGIKAVMAKAMVESVATIPHFTYCEEIDMTELIKLRGELKDVYARQDLKLTMMPFFMKTISLALKQFPIINSQVNADCTELTYFDDHNIGMAVDSKVGLLVPNVKQVQNKSIIELAQDIMRLTQSAREGRVAAADLKGGTISISNIGAIGGTVATPIINKPETAIVALGKVQTLPRYNANGDLEARQIMQVSWSGDHRVIDGGSIARFCNLWKSLLEDPSQMIMLMS